MGVHGCVGQDGQSTRLSQAPPPPNPAGWSPGAGHPPNAPRSAPAAPRCGSVGTSTPDRCNEEECIRHVDAAAREPWTSAGTAGSGSLPAWRHQLDTPAVVRAAILSTASIPGVVRIQRHAVVSRVIALLDMLRLGLGGLWAVHGCGRPARPRLPCNEARRRSACQSPPQLQHKVFGI